MNRPAIVLALVSALFLGASLGFMGGVLFSSHQFGGGPRAARRLHDARRAGRPNVRMMPPARVILPWLRRELDLSPEQAEAIRGEIERSRSELASVHDSVQARISRHLTTAQRDRFHRLVNESSLGQHRGRRPHFLRAEPGSEGDPK